MRTAPQHQAGMTALTVNKPDPKVLQDFLALKFALSRRTAKAVVDGRSVWVNRKCIWMARHTLKTGDLIEIPTQVGSYLSLAGGLIGAYTGNVGAMKAFEDAGNAIGNSLRKTK